MTTQIQVNDLHELLGTTRQQQAVYSHNEEGLGRSYVCSMSSIVDLEGHTCTELAHNIQRYLSRIVEELHLISAWSSSINHEEQQNVGSRIDDNSLTALARLAVITDIELLRNDMAKAQHELFQRCTTQIVYVQSEASVAATQQDKLYHKLKQDVEDQQQCSGQLAQAIQALKKAQADSDAQVKNLTTTLHQMQQNAAHPARIIALEKYVNTAQFSHEQEVQTLLRRVESIEITNQLQLEGTRPAADESLTELRLAEAQLTKKLQVELQELNEKRQQHWKVKTVKSGIISPKPSSLTAFVAAPRRPNISTTRTPRSGGNTAASPRSQGDHSGINSNMIDGVICGGSKVRATVDDAVSTTDCIMYTKPTLLHRSSITDASTSIKKPILPPSSSQALVSTGGANLTRSRSSILKPQDSMIDLLKVQQSVLSVPLGYENVAPSVEVSDDNSSSSDRPDPLIPTRRGFHRHIKSAYR